MKQEIKDKYIFFPNAEEEFPYTVAHIENDTETIIAVTNNAEKAHFLTTAANQYKEPEQPISDDDIRSEIEDFYKVKDKFTQNADLIRRVISKTIKTYKAAQQQQPNIWVDDKILEAAAWDLLAGFSYNGFLSDRVGVEDAKTQIIKIFKSLLPTPPNNDQSIK